MHTGNAGALVIADRAADVEWIAMSIVGVGEDGHRHRLDNIARVRDHFGDRDLPHVRLAVDSGTGREAPM